MGLEFFQVDHETGKISSRPLWLARQHIKIVFRCTKCKIFFERDKQLILHKQRIHPDDQPSDHIEVFDVEKDFHINQAEVQSIVDKNEKNPIDCVQVNINSVGDSETAECNDSEQSVSIVGCIQINIDSGNESDNDVEIQDSSRSSSVIDSTEVVEIIHLIEKDVNLAINRSDTTVHQNSEETNASNLNSKRKLGRSFKIIRSIRMGGHSSNSRKDTFPCLICGKNFLSELFRNRHIKKHLKIIPKKLTPTNQKRNETKNQKLITSYFKRKSHRIQNRLSGSKTPSNKSPIQQKSNEDAQNQNCMVCKQSYASDYHLQRHFRTSKHRNAVGSQRKILKEASTNCENNLGNTEGTLNLETDLTLTPTPCIVLDDSISPSSSKRFNCDACDQDFRSMNTLTRHKNTDHLELECQTLFTCMLCSKSFLWEKTLTHHMKSHK